MPSKRSRELWTQFVQQEKRRPSAPAASVIRGPGKPFCGKVLGIDPSLRGTGLAIIQVETGPSLGLITSRRVHLKPKVSFAQCLATINESVEDMLNRHEVDHVALEQTIYVQNFQTAQILGAARGAAIAAAARQGKPIFEYPPLRIKQAIVGFGRASKEQVSGILTQLLTIREPLSLDETDAAGAAVCHALTYREES